MEWISRYGQALGWTAFIAAFLIVVLQPAWAWFALPLYLVAGVLFGVVILERRRRKGS